MTNKRTFDFWYAVNNTEIVRRPAQTLETFGQTLIRYHLVSELMDAVDKVRVREGTIHAFRPQILTPPGVDDQLLDGFQHEESSRYVQWLREHQSNLLAIQYGFRIRRQTLTEEILSDSLETVVERIRAQLAERNDPLQALVVGVDEPWEVCLLRLAVEMIQQSAPKNFMELREDPSGVRHEVERAFRAASKDRAAVPALAALLREKGLFREYEDRFFALVRSHPA